MRTAPRYRIGRDLLPVTITAEAAWLEGRHRLRPGRIVELTGVPLACGPQDRHVMVESWEVSTLGKNGTTYRGKCLWIDPRG
jgi:hypothetical protein